MSTRVRRLVVDVDGCLTNGTFLWTHDGKKWAKAFGSDDWDALCELQARGITIVLVSSDAQGWAIVASRAKHVGLDAQLVKGGVVREAFVREGGATGYIGDSLEDVAALKAAIVSFAPVNAHPAAKLAADVVLPRTGGDRAVALACHLLSRHRVPRALRLRRRARVLILGREWRYR